MNDFDLIKLIVQGNEKAFELFYAKYAAKVYNISLSYTKNTADAEEITQEVFIKIFKKVESFKGDSTLNTWIYRVTINTALNFIEKKNKLIIFKQNYQSSQETYFDHPGTQPDQKETARILFKAIDCLKGNQKTAFILCYIDNLSRKEAAEIMNTSVKSIESLLQRAKKKLRLELDELKKYRRNS